MLYSFIYLFQIDTKILMCYIIPERSGQMPGIGIFFQDCRIHEANSFTNYYKLIQYAATDLFIVQKLLFFNVFTEFFNVGNCFSNMLQPLYTCKSAIIHILTSNLFEWSSTQMVLYNLLPINLFSFAEGFVNDIEYRHSPTKFLMLCRNTLSLNQHHYSHYHPLWQKIQISKLFQPARLFLKNQLSD